MDSSVLKCGINDSEPLLSLTFSSSPCLEQIIWFALKDFHAKKIFSVIASNFVFGYPFEVMGGTGSQKPKWLKILCYTFLHKLFFEIWQIFCSELNFGGHFGQPFF